MEIATARPVERFSHTQSLDKSYHFGSGGTLLQFTTGYGSERPSCMFSFDHVSSVPVSSNNSALKSSKLLKEKAISLSNFTCKRRLDFNRLTLGSNAILQDENCNNNNNLNSINNNHHIDNLDLQDSFISKVSQQHLQSCLTDSQHQFLEPEHSHLLANPTELQRSEHHQSSISEPQHYHQSNIQEPQGSHHVPNLPESQRSSHQQRQSNQNHHTSSRRNGHHQNQIKPLTTAVQRRNERERNRVKLINMTFASLREHLPNGTKGSRSKKMSKVETLKAAIEYIRYLKQLVDDHDTVNTVLDSSILSASSALTSASVLTSQPGLSPSTSVSSPVHSSCSDSSCEGISVDEDDLLDFSTWF